ENYDDNLVESNIGDSDEPLDIGGENISCLDIKNFIDLNHDMYVTNSEILTKEFIHDLNFDVDTILNRVKN
ncbi:9297_t:CDS:1, partial [Entrophospora sp. SA101]